MKTSVEKIYSKLYTVISHSGVIENTLGRRFATLHDGSLAIFKDADCLHHIATALPALPLNPKPDDAPLLYRYMSEGLEPVLKFRKAQEWGFEDFIRDVEGGL